MVSHAFNKDHRINWNQSKIIFKSSDVHVRRLIEGAAINLGDSFKGNKSFVNEDPFVNFYITKSFLKHFNFKTGSVFPNPDAASLLPLPVQVTTPLGDEGYGAQPDNLEDDPRPTAEQPLRRSRRIAERNATRDGIT